MKPFSAAAILFLFVGFCGCAPKTDTGATAASTTGGQGNPQSSSIVGKWEGKIENEISSGTTELEFFDDGRMTQKTSIIGEGKSAGEKTVYKTLGNYQVIDKHLVMTVLKVEFQEAPAKTRAAVEQMLKSTAGVKEELPFTLEGDTLSWVRFNESFSFKRK